MNTLSNLKKTLVLGREIEMLTYNGGTPAPRIAGTRQVVKVQTNGVWLAHDPVSTTRSFFDFPKASQIEWHSEKHFTISDMTDDKRIWCSREYLIKN